jgi:triosephosphate isomerase
MELTWASYLCGGVPPIKRCLIGGNWKCNGTVAQAKSLVKLLNDGGKYPLASEVRVLMM